MNFKLMATLVVFMTIFAFTATVSATPGDSASDPVDILYVYSSWGGTPFITYPDLANAGAGSLTMGGQTIYYKVTKVDGYNNNWTGPSAALKKFVNSTTSNYSNATVDAEIVFFDMVNLYQNRPNEGAYFASAAANAANNNKTLVAVRTGPNNNSCYMPPGFSIRDTGDYTYANVSGTTVATQNTNLSAVLVNGSANPYYNATFTNKFFKIHDSPNSGAPGMVGVADSTHSDAMLKLLIAEERGLNLPTFSLNP